MSFNGCSQLSATACLLFNVGRAPLTQPLCYLLFAAQALNASQLPGHAVATTTLLASAAAATLWAATKGSTQAPVVPEEATAPTQQQQQQQVQWCREVTATAAEQEHSRMHALPSNPVALSRNADSRVSTSTPVVAAAVLAEGGAAVSNDFGDAGSWAISDEQQQLQQQHQVPSAAQHSALDQIQEALGVLGGGLLLQVRWWTGHDRLCAARRDVH